MTQPVTNNPNEPLKSKCAVRAIGNN
jgi:hypothetical protein